MNSRLRLVLLVAVLLSLPLAAKLALTIRDRQAVAGRVNLDLAEWHARMGSELPAAQRASWQRAAAAQPVSLMRSCAFEVVKQRDFAPDDEALAAVPQSPDTSSLTAR